MTNCPMTKEFNIPAQLAAELDEVVTHYPQKRSASLMVLHALQEHSDISPPGRSSGRPPGWIYSRSMFMSS